MDKTKQILFIQGGGDDGYKADQQLVDRLREDLGEAYEVNYPHLRTDEEAPDFGWLKQIGAIINNLDDGTVLVAHSLGASLLLKYLSENSVAKKIAGIYLLATPFWSGDEEWKQGLKLQAGFAEKLPKETPLYFYHCRDDDEVPIAQLATFRHKLPLATFREVESGGHQFSNGLGLLANDIMGI